MRVSRKVVLVCCKQNYGYSVGQLWDLLQEIRVHYNEVLMQHWVQVFRDILDEDSFLPIQVIINIHTYTGIFFQLIVCFRSQRKRNTMKFLICFLIMTRNCRKPSFPRNFHSQTWCRRFINK